MKEQENHVLIQAERELKNLQDELRKWSKISHDNQGAAIELSKKYNHRAPKYWPKEDAAKLENYCNITWDANHQYRLLLESYRQKDAEVVKLRAQAKWQRHFNLVKEYVAKFGKLPTQSTVYEGVNLGIWLQRQRAAYGEGTLSPECKAQLESIGFSFDNQAQAMPVDKKCYFCSRKDNLQLDTLQRHGEMLLVSLCPEHYEEQGKLREMVRQNYQTQFDDNWH